ncbi:MFS transporter [Actinomadura rudentiformis]|uniref:MFS transporter n=1 Tax=Actinomadura rudentiformis TaxID=359158 RepID=A0A6H9YPI5_9ACTN|nr:MFS transporter [Actinomadura rudentiformis]KAB2349065.1 MFS transporter [Actinomadura rudentiformis]
MRRGALLAVLCAAQVMLVLDLVVVTVALPAMRADLGIAEGDLQWVVTAYGLAYGGFMIVAGRAGDLYGHRRVLVTGLVVFIAASALAGLAAGAPLMFGARALQGLGAALVSPAALALVVTGFAEGEARNRALGIWGAVGSGGAAAAGLVGGVLTDLVDWRAVFLVNLPIGVLVILVVLWAVPGGRPAGRARLDLPGSVLLTAGAVLFVAAVSRAAGGVTFRVLGMAAGAVGLLGAFVVVERAVRAPVVRLSMFRDPHVRYGNLVCALIASAALVTQFFATLHLQNVAGLGALATGLVFAPVTLIIVVVSGKAGALVSRFGARATLVAAAGCTALGLLAMAAGPAAIDGWAALLPGLLISGLGAGLAYAPSMMVATTGVADAEQGLASGLLNTSFQLGAPLGLALMSTVAAVAGGYQAAFLAALVFPALVLVAVQALPRESPAPQPE